MYVRNYHAHKQLSAGKYSQRNYHAHKQETRIIIRDTLQYLDSSKSFRKRRGNYKKEEEEKKKSDLRWVFHHFFQPDHEHIYKIL